MSSIEVHPELLILTPNNMQLLNNLNWRYATKKFDPVRKIDQFLVDQVVEAARLAPTSSGVQPFIIIEVTNQELKEKIVSIANNQQQIADCSHLLVFAAWDTYTRERIDKRYERITSERMLPPAHYKSYTDLLKSTYLQRPAQVNFEHAARQSYIGFAMAIAAAAELRIDATPMEGFDNHALDILLGLAKSGLKTVTLLPMGYREAENDYLVNMKKVRVPLADFLYKVNRKFRQPRQTSARSR